jgi:hypothetical protein
MQPLFRRPFSRFTGKSFLGMDKVQKAYSEANAVIFSFVYKFF